MCGRFTLSVPPELLAEHFELERMPGPEGLEARYNIAPTQLVAAVRQTRDGARRLDLLRWGLVPHWAKDTSIAAKLINARAETLATKPAFRAAFHRRRCLIPASGFFEWQKRGKNTSQPFHIHAPGGAPLAFAGLWERWGKDAATVDTCTIITVDATPALATIHPRMPAILRPEQFSRWLERPTGSRDVDIAAVQAMLRSTPGLVATKVGPEVSDLSYDAPSLVEPSPDGERDAPLLDHVGRES